MEKASYRENLRMISEKCGGKQVLTPADAAGVLGVDKRTVLKHFGSYFNRFGNRMFVSACDLARAISK